MKKYIAVKPNKGNITHLRVDLDYQLGGMNVFTYKREPRGYYLSVCPVERENRGNGVVMESFTAFTGTKMLVKEVTRKSAKAEREAEDYAATRERELIDYILAKHGLELESEQP